MMLKAGVLLLVVLFGLEKADEPPKVEVYSCNHGQNNTLSCFVSGFHPPKIDITLLKKGEPLSDVQYTDVAFSDKWYFQRQAYAPFVPQKGDIYTCSVAHSTFKEPQTF